MFWKNGDGEWSAFNSPMEAMIGKNGFVEPEQKKEGDGNSPEGIYRLGRAFGYDPQISTRLPYIQVTPEDVWVYDPESPDYNHLVKKSGSKAKSFEVMRRNDEIYRYGIVVEYNTNPVIKGNGSAIFFPVWRKKGSPTLGCIALSRENIVKILAWLEPKENPVVALGSSQYLDFLKK